VSKLAPIAPITSPSTPVGSPPCISTKPCAVTAATRPWLIASSRTRGAYLPKQQQEIYTKADGGQHPPFAQTNGAGMRSQQYSSSPEAKLRRPYVVDILSMSPVGTNLKCRLTPKLSAYGGRPEVTGTRSERRD
jgi:hypothetical protein